MPKLNENSKCGRCLRGCLIVVLCVRKKRKSVARRDSELQVGNGKGRDRKVKKKRSGTKRNR